MAQAHGVQDQYCPSGQGWYTMYFQLPIGQGFTPTKDTLVAVEAWLTTANPDGDATITVRIREGTISGTIVATTSDTVPEGFDGWWHFDLPSIIPVTPGSQYVMELGTTNYTHARHDDGGIDSCPGGTGWMSGLSSPRDFGYDVL